MSITCGLPPACAGGFGRVCASTLRRYEHRLQPLLEVRRGEREVRDVRTSPHPGRPRGSLERRNHWEKTSHSCWSGDPARALCRPTRPWPASRAFLFRSEAPDRDDRRAMMTTPHLVERPLRWSLRRAREPSHKSEKRTSGVLSTAMSFWVLYRTRGGRHVTRRCECDLRSWSMLARPPSLYPWSRRPTSADTKPADPAVSETYGRR